MFGDLDDCIDNMDNLDLDDDDEPKLHKFEVFPTDIWSMGLTIFTYFNGQPPYNATSDFQIIKKMREEELPTLEGYSDDLNDLLSNMTNKDPKQRLTVKEVLEHKWFNN